MEKEWISACVHICTMHHSAWYNIIHAYFTHMLADATGLLPYNIHQR